MTLRGKLPPWAVLSIIGVVGLICLGVGNSPWGNWGEWPSWAHGVVRDIGIALFTTSVLGFTVDRWLKLDIAVDVFRAALGYVLPDAFRGEVRRISNYKLLAEKHALILQIERLDPDTVRVTCMLERTIRNISSEAQPYANQLDIDEWGFPEAKSEILECEIRDEGQTVHRFRQVEYKGHYLHAETEKLLIPPEGRAFISSKFSEVKRIDGDIIMVSTTPTQSPEIEVQIPDHNLRDELEYQVSFGHPGEVIEKAKYSSRHTMKGTYFPNQVMRLRWWLKRK